MRPVDALFAVPRALTQKHSCSRRQETTKNPAAAEPGGEEVNEDRLGTVHAINLTGNSLVVKLVAWERRLPKTKKAPPASNRGALWQADRVSGSGGHG